MGQPIKIIIASDIHYAGPKEKARQGFEADAIRNPLTRQLAMAYRHLIWLSEPLAHSGMLDRLIEAVGQPDFTIVNGDYSCDSAFTGVADDGAYESAAICLAKLRHKFGRNLAATMGDHELGKLSLFGGQGGLRLSAYLHCLGGLALQPFWQLEFGRYLMVGVASSIIALPVLEKEALPEEISAWRTIREEHLRQIEACFAAVKPEQKILLFTHDPTSLPFLLEIESLKNRLPQIERTIIGHLHTNAVLKTSGYLSGMPPIHFLGNSVRRMSTALCEARKWKAFNLLLCPSLTGIELLKDGGFYKLELDPDALVPARFQFQPLPWV
jgi:hypothetical protein